MSFYINLLIGIVPPLREPRAPICQWRLQFSEHSIKWQFTKGLAAQTALLLIGAERNKKKKRQGSDAEGIAASRGLPEYRM